MRVVVVVVVVVGVVRVVVRVDDAAVLLLLPCCCCCRGVGCCGESTRRPSGSANTGHCMAGEESELSAALGIVS